MIHIQAVGAPFNISYSSCGTRSPKTFSWSNTENEIKVYMDSHLLHGLNGNKNNKKFGWFCESRIVKQSVFEHIKNNLNLYKESYNKLFTCDEELIKMDSNFFVFCFAGSNLPWTPEQEYGLHNKTKNISFLCSSNSMSDGHRYRISWAEKLKNRVDLYGGVCGSKKIGVVGNQHYHHKRKTEAMNDYMFSVVIENDSYETYFTEKITDCFATGTIPVYWGTSDIGNYFNKDGIIELTPDFDFSSLTPELYNSKISAIRDNLERVKNMELADDVLFKLITNEN